MHRGLRIHLHAPVEGSTFHDAHPRREDVAANLRSRAHDYRLGAVEITLHQPLDREVVRVYIAEHRTLGADDEIARVTDGALDAPLQNDVLLGGELATKQQGLAEY